MCFLFFLNSCISFDFKNYYTSLIDTNIIQPEYKLQQGEKPKVYFSRNLNQDILEIESQHYTRLGYSFLNGAEASDNEVRNAAINLAKEKGAKIALYNYYYTDTRGGSITLPSSQTSQHSGNIYSGGNSAYYSGTTITSGTSTINYNVRMYDFITVLFVPMSEYSPPIVLGFNWMPLTNEIRRESRTNIGLYVNVVYKNTPAYYSDIMIGDIIVNINDFDIYDINHMQQFFRTLNPGDKLTIKLLRNRENKIIEYNIK
jgi:hypothetical protein